MLVFSCRVNAHERQLAGSVRLRESTCLHKGQWIRAETMVNSSFARRSINVKTDSKPTTTVLGGQSEYSQLLKELELHSRLDRDTCAGESPLQQQQQAFYHSWRCIMLGWRPDSERRSQLQTAMPASQPFLHKAAMHVYEQPTSKLMSSPQHCLPASMDSCCSSTGRGLLETAVRQLARPQCGNLC
jgi:hypothetical protein